mgnify:CR=1 FL=1
MAAKASRKPSAAPEQSAEAKKIAELERAVAKHLDRISGLMGHLENSKRRCESLTVDMFTGEAVPLAPAARVDEANWFAEASDYETMSDSMDSFARNWAANDAVDPEGERLTVVMGFWHDGVAFTVSADGRALSEIGGDHG